MTPLQCPSRSMRDDHAGRADTSARHFRRPSVLASIAGGMLLCREPPVWGRYRPSCSAAKKAYSMTSSARAIRTARCIVTGEHFRRRSHCWNRRYPRCPRRTGTVHGRLRRRNKPARKQSPRGTSTPHLSTVQGSLSSRRSYSHSSRCPKCVNDIPRTRPPVTADGRWNAGPRAQNAIS